MEQLTPEKAVKILKQYGTIVNITEAKLIIDLLYKLADIAISQYLREKNDDNIIERNYSE